MRRIETAHPIEGRWGDRVWQSSRPTAGTHAVHQLGFWSATLSAVFIVLSLTWVIGAPAAFVLLAVLFKRAARQPAI